MNYILKIKIFSRVYFHLVSFYFLIYNRKGNNFLMDKKMKSEIFFEKANIKHNNKFDYSMSVYDGAHSYIKIICPVHGVFEQRSNSHLSCGCAKCMFDEKRSSRENFIKKSINIQGMKYDYSLVSYVNCTTKVKIICPTHGVFEQLPDNHTSKGVGCPYCKESQGEKKTRIILDNQNIKYIRQYKFTNCKDIKPLPFDFYLPDYNTCIEYDGKQHYTENCDFGKNGGYEITVKHDKIKNDYCIDNNIKLIRIKYTEDIDSKLKENLNYAYI